MANGVHSFSRKINESHNTDAANEESSKIGKIVLSTPTSECRTTVYG